MVYKWDEMTPKQRDLLIAKTFGFTSEDFFNFAWESGAFNYSSNISWSWNVVEKLRIAITPQSADAPWNMKYMAEKYGTKLDRSDDIRAFCATPSEAICKVALKAVGVEIE